MIKGLLWCFAILGVQLALLRYVDLRVAAMPRLQEPPEESIETEATPPSPGKAQLPPVAGCH